MNFTKAILSILTLASAFLMSSANATTIVNSYSQTPNFSIGNDDFFHFTFNFAKNGDVLGSTLYDAGTLFIRLTDKAGGEDGAITFGNQKVIFKDLTNNTRDTADGNTYKFTLDAANLADLNDDGMISFSINGISGDFYFAAATLSANLATVNAAAVPEPMSLGLLAIGMLGLGAARRRRASK